MPWFALGTLAGLDGRHSVFGEVISGLDVLTSISNVATTNNKPVVDVVFNRVEIQRVGEAASNFLAAAHGLPVVGGSDVAIARAGTGDLQVTYDGRSNSHVIVYGSEDAVAWSVLDSAWHIDVPPPSVINLVATAPVTLMVSPSPAASGSCSHL